jgi:hypothetical protein
MFIVYIALYHYMLYINILRVNKWFVIINISNFILVIIKEKLSFFILINISNFVFSSYKKFQQNLVSKIFFITTFGQYFSINSCVSLEILEFFLLSCFAHYRNFHSKKLTYFKKGWIKWIFIFFTIKNFDFFFWGHVRFI